MKLAVGVLDKTPEKRQFHEIRLFDSRTLLVVVPRFTSYFPYRPTDMFEIRQRKVSYDVA
jgi:hypothetical protein